MAQLDRVHAYGAWGWRFESSRARLLSIQVTDPKHFGSVFLCKEKRVGLTFIDEELDLDQFYMREALKLAKAAQEQDEVPVGAVITHQGKIIARAHNQVEMLKDPTAHAEMIAITQAASFLGNKWLYDCDIFVTIEPCSMCVGALVLARVKRVCFGAYDQKTGACGSVFNIAQSDDLNHKINITSGVLGKECADIISEFFRSKR